MQNDEPEQKRCCSPKGRDVWCQNLGPKDKAAKVMSHWLASIDYGEGT
jgi:hypothetical protein